MSEPDNDNVRLISDAVARGLPRNYAPKPLPIQEEADDHNGWRDILDRFEKQFRDAQAEEQER